MMWYGRHHVDEDDIQAVLDQMRHRSLTQGPAVGEFERAVASYVGARYGVAVTSGTAALHLACAAAGLGPGDTLVTSPTTFVASANCAAYVGATPEFADIDAATLNLDPAELERRCAGFQRVKAIVPVHFAGLPCAMPEIRAVANRHGAIVIEDASHGLGGRYPDGSRIGSCAHSEMTVFSFHPVKPITTAEGGMIMTNDEALYRDLLRLRSHGINKMDDALLDPEHAYTDGQVNPWYYEMQELGFNYRITEIQAALGSSQMRKLDRFLARRRALAARYDEAFRGSDFIKPAQATGRELSGHHLYTVRIPFGRGCVTRAVYMRRLFEAGITAQVHYVPVPLHPYYRRRGHRAEDYPNSWQYYQEALSIPFFYDLTDGEQDGVVRTLFDKLH
jgi:perosamine synthetase